MGLHTGEASCVGGGLRRARHPPRRADRGRGHGGQVLVSDATRALAGDACRPASRCATWASTGSRTSRGPSALYQVVVDGLPSRLPAAAHARRHAQQPATAADHASSAASARSPTARRCSWRGRRLLTLTGPGGTGKTRLALAGRAPRSRDDFPDGVVFVALAPITDPALVPSRDRRRRSALLDAGADRRSRAARRASAATGRLLLVLDNFEQVVAGAPRRRRPARGGPEPDGARHQPRAAPDRRASRSSPVPPLGAARPAGGDRPRRARWRSRGGAAVHRARAWPSGPDFALTTRTRRPSPRSCAASTACRWRSSSPRPGVRLLSPAALLARLERRWAC